MRIPEIILAFETLTGKPVVRSGFDKGRSLFLILVKPKEGRHDGLRFAFANASEIKSEAKKTALFLFKTEFDNMANPFDDKSFDDG